MAAVDPAQPQAQGLSGRWRRIDAGLRPRLSGFWHWWTGALAAWLPARVRDLLGWIPQRLLFRRVDTQVTLSMLRGGGVRSTAALPLADLHASVADPLAGLLAQRHADVPRWLVLPAAMVLRRSLTLPAAAADRLRDVLAFEIDRQTPFTAADVHHDARLLARRGDGQLDVELVVVPKAAVNAELDVLGPIAATLAGVDVDDGRGGTLGVNLLPTARQLRREDPWRKWNLVFAAVAVLALAAGLWQMLDNRRTAADLFAQQVDEQVRQARGAAVEQRRLLNLVEGTRFLQDTRAGLPTTVEVVDELARRLPDNTYLEKLSIEGDRILLIGLSGEASSLVQQLEGSALWRNAALAGALQPDPRTRRDRFTLTAQRVVRGADSPGAPDNAGVANAR
ncbi:general secretion pathway protein GspL [Luteimonas aestuarii]|uniref:General secretion pathway protein GspL n=1 Tax=Luteimonas aestuarii TaxID=453837 RepID=A0A4R5TKP9_9GAMM|nr:PilN domain-containing protein [Luteimonas aestuarii]TDK20629.1 general secretion pathway protein GspL [Luteimonas aestuarii]